MRGFRSLLAVLLILGALDADEVRAQRASSLRVLHWNVLHSGSGTDGKLDRARQVERIAAEVPDIVTLNEVTESAASDYASRLRAATQRAWFLHHVAAVRGSDGNAILSRYPIIGTGGRVLTRNRSVAQATVDVAGTPVNVFATHLESRDERASRAEQVKLLLPYLARFAAPRIVNGDFNAGPDAAEIRPLLEAYVDAWDRALEEGNASAYADNPPGRHTRTRGTRIDYILTSADGGLHVTGCRIPDLRDLAAVNVEKLVGTSDDRGVRPSDHNLVSCTMTLRGGQSQAASPGSSEDVASAEPVPAPIQSSTPAQPSAPARPAAAEPAAAAQASAAASAESQPATRARQQQSTTEIVLWATEATEVRGWSVVPDSGAAGGARLATWNAGEKETTPLASPLVFFDLEFEAEAGRPYRLWVRGRAEPEHSFNDSVYVQFSGSTSADGRPVHRIGTTSAATVILEEFLHAGLSGWAWADSGWEAAGAPIYFEKSGPQRLRVQLRQDGVSLDQIVLSAGEYLSRPPGATKNDRTILPR